ncbi:MAG: hypothetical protein WDO24_05940 [Pseudomonadota bacterium]
MRALLLADIGDGHLDNAGPLFQGRRFALRLTSENPEGGKTADLIPGRKVIELFAWLRERGDESPASAAMLRRSILVMKVAVLDFAFRHELPSPSWWDGADSQFQSSINLGPATTAAIPDAPIRTTDAQVAGKNRPFTAKTAEAFATEYLARQRAAGASPTLKGAEAEARAASRGGRELLRKAYRGLERGLSRGRPRNAREDSQPKFAK